MMIDGRNRTSFRSRLASWFTVGAGILALTLSGAGAAAADEGDLPPPTIITTSDGSFPHCIAVKWSDPDPLSETIAGFSIERTEPLWQQTVGREQHSVMTPCDMKPDTKAHFKVCVLY